MKLAEKIIFSLNVDEASYKGQVNGLVMETILPAFNEDFEFKSKKDAEGALKLLKDMINKFKVVVEKYENEPDVISIEYGR